MLLLPWNSLMFPFSSTMLFGLAREWPGVGNVLRGSRTGCLHLQADLIPSPCMCACAAPTSGPPLFCLFWLNGGRSIFWSPSEVCPSAAALLHCLSEVGFPLLGERSRYLWETMEVLELQASMYNIDLSTIMGIKVELSCKSLSPDTYTKTLAMTPCFPLESYSRTIKIHIICRCRSVCVFLELRFLWSIPGHLAFSMN